MLEEEEEEECARIMQFSPITPQSENVRTIMK
jgi:hypothetical protein